MRVATRHIKALVFATLAVAPLGCNSLLGNDGWSLEADAAADAGPPMDGPFLRPDAGGTGRDTSATDSTVAADDSSVPSFDSSPPPSDSGSGPIDTGTADTGLNPGLVVPPPGTQCMPSLGDSDCLAGETCRISSVNLGTCDTYWVGPPDHNGQWPCTVDSDCSDTLQCWMGECKVLCPLGTPCAGGCECLDVGNQTTGICCPGL
jgi:hypothetical protein